MRLVSMVCQRCGANLKVNVDAKQAYCTYCGAMLLIDDETVNVNQRFYDEARIREADVRMKELEYEHERQMKIDEDMRRQNKYWRYGAMAYFAALILTGVFNMEAMAVILIFGGIALAVLKPKEKIKRFAYQQPVSRKSKWTAFALCFFFGWIGVHYFYVGKAGMGVLYIFTGGLFGIGWFVDLIRILCGTFPDQFGFYLRA